MNKTHFFILIPLLSVVAFLIYYFKVYRALSKDSNFTRYERFQNVVMCVIFGSMSADLIVVAMMVFAALTGNTIFGYLLGVVIPTLFISGIFCGISKIVLALREYQRETDM